MTAFELDEEFETKTFTAPALATSLAGIDTAIVWQSLDDVHGIPCTDGLRTSFPKCTLEAVESP